MSDSALRVSQRVLHLLNQIVQVPHIFIVLRTDRNMTLYMGQFLKFVAVVRSQRRTDPSFSICLDMSFMISKKWFHA